MSIKKKIGAFLFSIGMLNFIGISHTEANNVMENEIILTQNMGKQIANERLMINDGKNVTDATMMYHYSHRSHFSHTSHRSHYSHYSSYY